MLRRWAGADDIAHLITLIAAATLLLISGPSGVPTLGPFGGIPGKVRVEFFRHANVGPGLRRFWRAAVYLRDAGDLGWSALIMAVPLGVGAAIFLAELAPPKLSSSLTFVSDLLAAVPSVIYGLLGVFLLVPLMRTTIQPALKETLGIFAAVSRARRTASAF